MKGPINLKGRVHLAAVAAVLAALWGAAPAAAATDLAAGASFPDSVAVGDREFSGSIQFTPSGGGKLVLNSIKLNPSCASVTLPCTPSDAGVFTVNGTGLGGGACAGRTFSVSAPAADGTLTLAAVPGDSHNPTVDPLEVASGGTCVVTLSLNVIKLPTVDTAATTGIQTIQQVQVTGTSQPDGLPLSASGFDQTTVRKRAPTLTAAAFGAGQVGGELFSIGTLADAFSPTGTMTFSLFGPVDPTCAAPPAFSSSVAVGGLRTTSPTYPSTAAGTYRWTVAYSGDANNDAVAVACNAPGTTVVVSTAVPTPRPGGGSPSPAVAIAPAVAPALGMPRLSPSRFRAAGSGPSTSARLGTVVRYTLSKAAKVTFRVERAASGRRAGGRCVRPRRALRRAKRCTRYLVMAGSFADEGAAGSNTFTFRGRVGGRKLRPGRYRLRALARDGNGRESQVRRPAFRIVR
jgi:hypothetical protein